MHTTSSSEIIEDPARISFSPRRRYVFFSLILAVIMGGLGLRSAYLQLWQGKTFRAQAEGNRITILPLPAPRGLIFDTEGKLLVDNIASTDLILDPALLPRLDEEGSILEELPRIVPELSIDKLRTQLAAAREQRRTVVLLKALDHDTILRLETMHPAIPGIRLVSALVRNYSFPDVLAHVLGYTSPITSEELQTNRQLLPTDMTGKAGIEKFYESTLRGEPGFTYVETNAEGRPQADLGKQDAAAGKNIQLNIDLPFQEHIYDVFRETEAARKEKGIAEPLRGAVVALEPKTGAVRALASYPGFDINAFSQPARVKETAGLFTAETKPLFNRAVNGMYPPGSTIKPFLAAGALQEDIISRETTVMSHGGIRIGIWNFPDWKAGGHGLTDVKKAISESVNTFFYLITGGDETRQGLGVERATAYLKDFGWGEATGIDLPQEAGGFLPSPEWKERAKQEAWYIGDTYHLAIGQGDVLVTPLQVGVATAAIANGQYRYQPRIAQRPSQRFPLRTNPAELALVREGMRQTVTDGSGRRLASLPIALAGKTGTAQIGGDEKTHAWFTSFGPYEDPDLVVTVLLEEAGEGDKVAVPFAEKVWQWWIEHRVQQK